MPEKPHHRMHGSLRRTPSRPGRDPFELSKDFRADRDSPSMKRAAAAVVNAIVLVLSFVLQLVHLAAALAAAAVTLPLELLFAVPVIGRLARQLACVAGEIVWRAAGLPDLLLGALGVLPEKKLRLQVVIQRDENGEPIATTARALTEIQAVIDVFMDAAKVRVLPVRWATFSTPFSERETADERFVRTASKPTGAAQLDLACGAGAWLRDMGTTGTAFSLGMSKLGALRRLLGYG